MNESSTTLNFVVNRSIKTQLEELSKKLGLSVSDVSRMSLAKGVRYVEQLAEQK